MRSPAPVPCAETLRQLRLTPGLQRSGLAPAPRLRISTSSSELDALLGGGLPCGVVTELVGRRSSGRTTLAYAVAAAVTSRGELMACVDLPNAFDPEHAAATGIRLPRVLWIRPPDPRTALRATEQVLVAGGFRLVLLDLDVGLRWQVPQSVWLRLGRAAARSGAAVVALGTERLVGAFAALSLEVVRHRVAFTGHGGPCPLFDGINGMVRLRKSRLEPSRVLRTRLFATAAT